MMAWAHSVGGGGEVHAFDACLAQTSGLGLEESRDRRLKETIDQVP